MLEKIKKSLRINNDAYDDEIESLISSSKADLKLAGVASSLIKDEDPLIERAIVTYSKANFGLENPDSDKYQRSYDLLKQHLAIAYHEDTPELRKLIKEESKDESI